MSQVAVIGGGAAGMFAAINCSVSSGENTVHLYERTGNLLSKLRISGGGRCNVTNACLDNNLLIQGYPRGSRELRSAFSQFSVPGTIQWFESRGVKLKAEKDGRMFPVTDSSETVARCLEKAAEDARVKIHLHEGVNLIEPIEHRFLLTFNSGRKISFDKVLVACGGGPNLGSYRWMEKLELEIVPPVPSLFTFNVPDKTLHKLTGISVDPVEISVIDSKLKQTGPLLITHWGLSGPAVLRLSAWGARELAGRDYHFLVRVNWAFPKKEEQVLLILQNFRRDSPKKRLASQCPLPDISQRLWEWLLEKSLIAGSKNWADLSNKEAAALSRNLQSMEISVAGKSTFKDEFVTAGGISLKEVDMKTMESKKWRGLYFAGEILDIDGITGGYNFQAAWTTGFIAAKNMAI